MAAVPMTAEPGTRFEYGLGADIAGALIERVAKQRLDAFLHARLFAPMQMRDTTFVVSASQAARLVSAYRVDGQTFVRIEAGAESGFRVRPRAMSGGGGWDNLGHGGFVTTAQDFHKFLQMLLDDGVSGGRRILSRDSVDAIFANQLAGTPTAERVPGVGFGTGAAVVVDAGRYGVPTAHGLVFWSGSLNTRFWIQRAEKLAGVYLSQVEPFGHLDLMNEVMIASLRPLSPDEVDAHGVVASHARHDGRDALRLVESDAMRATGFAVVKGVSLRDGRIDVDLAGRRGPSAKDDDRGFVGIAFHVGEAGDYDVIYLRPDNGRADDQLQRNHAVQYAAHPAFPWQRLRKESPGVFESYVDLESGVWTHMRIVIDGKRASLFVGNAAQPTLIVNELKGSPDGRGVALWIGAGSEAFFANLRVTSR
jgi:hypothetical protein